MSENRGLSEKTKRMIILKIKYASPAAFKNKLSYCRKQVKNGTMSEETFGFIETVIEKRKKERKTEK